ncbi:uncharacterized protein V6R79_014427 [Siganus canaliculatus]
MRVIPEPGPASPAGSRTCSARDVCKAQGLTRALAAANATAAAAADAGRGSAVCSGGCWSMKPKRSAAGRFQDQVQEPHAPDPGRGAGLPAAVSVTHKQNLLQ